MILWTIALVDAGFGPFTGWIWPAEPKSVLVWYFYEYYGNVLILTAMATRDWWRGRPMKQFAVGAVGLIACEILEDLLCHGGP